MKHPLRKQNNRSHAQSAVPAAIPVRPLTAKAPDADKGAEPPPSQFSLAFAPAAQACFGPTNRSLARETSMPTKVAVHAMRAT